MWQYQKESPVKKPLLYVLELLEMFCDVSRDNSPTLYQQIPNHLPLQTLDLSRENHRKMERKVTFVSHRGRAVVKRE